MREQTTTIEMPVDQGAERAVLGALLYSPEAWGVVAPILRPSDFFSDAHRVIYAALGDMLDNGMHPDVVTLPAVLRDTKQLDAAGGVSYVSGLADDLPDVGNIGHYAGIVRAASVRRSLIRIGMEAIGLAQQEETADGALDAVSDRLAELQGRRSDGGLVALGAAVHDELLLMRSEAEGTAPAGILTGITVLDDRLRGLKPGHLIVIGSASGVGKTSLALTIAINVAVEQGKAVLYVSLEMGADELSRRALAIHADISEWALTHGRRQARFDEQDGGDWGHAAWSASQLDRARFHIADSGHVTPGQLRGRCRALQLRGGLDLVIVDYLQLMVTGQRHGNRTEEVSALSRGMKLLARDLGVPVICLSQISREPERRAAQASKQQPTEGRQPGEPRLSDLRESGSIGSDANTVLLLHRKTEGTDDEICHAVCIIAKQRSGPTGRVNLRFKPSTCRFSGGVT